eukprot:5448533-Pleurochrysis_carterae.AAC.6
MTPAVHTRVRSGPCLQVWLAKGFALNVSHMQLILNLIAMANQHAAKAAVVLQKWEQRDVFPMKALRRPTWLPMHRAARKSTHARQQDHAARACVLSYQSGPLAHNATRM